MLLYDSENKANYRNMQCIDKSQGYEIEEQKNQRSRNIQWYSTYAEFKAGKNKHVVFRHNDISQNNELKE